MTIEEYIVSQLDGSVTIEQIKFQRFVVSESHVWSEWTSDGFSCTIRFTINTIHGIEERSLFLSEDEIAGFLNNLFPPNE
jgi:hypothetical protein